MIGRAKEETGATAIPEIIVTATVLEMRVTGTTEMVKMGGTAGTAGMAGMAGIGGKVGETAEMEEMARTERAGMEGKSSIQIDSTMAGHREESRRSRRTTTTKDLGQETAIVLPAIPHRRKVSTVVAQTASSHHRTS